MIINNYINLKKFYLLLALICILLTSCTKNEGANLDNIEIIDKQSTIDVISKEKILKTDDKTLLAKKDTSIIVGDDSDDRAEVEPDNKYYDKKDLLNEISNSLTPVNNPTDNISIDINDKPIITYRYYSPDYSTYIRCEVFYEQMYYHVKKLYIDDSSVPILVKELGEDDFMDYDIIDAALWVDNKNVILNGFYLYNIMTEKFWVFNKLSGIKPDQLNDYAINYEKTHIAFYTRDKVFVYSIFDNTLTELWNGFGGSIAHITPHKVLWDNNNNIYFEESYELIENNKSKEYRKIYQVNILTNEVETIFDGMFSLSSNSYDGKYLVINNYGNGTIKGAPYYVLDSKNKNVIHEYFGNNSMWSVREYNILNILYDDSFQQKLNIINLKQNNLVDSVNITEDKLANYFLYR